MKDIEVLENARIIGCTTTKAAMSKDLLNHVACGVVLVEEAAEIMEAHILTSMSEKCKHLIMIGDHKQLRPKAEHYLLTVESGYGYDLNVSLFERLTKTLQVSTLSKQHRMHPDISAIPKLITYTDELIDANETNASTIEGIAEGKRVIFVDHRELEDKPDELDPEAGTVSKTNSHEVSMIVGTIRYLLQQGYESSNLVVLTPYLGQLLKLQAALKNAKLEVLIDDMDFNEARNQLEGVQGFEISKEGKGCAEKSVRVATIDNYQGEEADVVLVSLVRSNNMNNIGFLREPERVNVMLSRAKHGEIIFGNKETLMNARGTDTPLKGGNLWRKIF